MSPVPAEAKSAPGPLILLIEDEVSFRRFLRPSLKAEGYRLIEADQGQTGLVTARESVPDMILLDLGLPDMDGLEVTRELRHWTKAPILILSAREQESDRVAALDAGADDYLTKPFGLAELLARIRVALRHVAEIRNRGSAEEFSSGPLKVNLTSRRVFIENREVRLTSVEYKLLMALVEHAGQVVTHRQLLAAGWGPDHRNQMEYLWVYMGHLRRKLEPDPTHPKIFQTEVGVGYRLLWE